MGWRCRHLHHLQSWKRNLALLFSKARSAVHPRAVVIHLVGQHPAINSDTALAYHQYAQAKAVNQAMIVIRTMEKVFTVRRTM